MVRNLAKKIVGKYDEDVFVSVGRYYKHINRVERRIKKFIWDTIVTVVLSLLIACGFCYVMYEYLCAPQGYYAEDYHYDMEGNKIHDGYHWVDPE